MPFPHPTGNEGPSYWISTTPSTAYPPLAEDVEADVVIVGGGIVGVMTSYLLAKAGRSVVVLDRERVGMAETGHTTAHLQMVLDTRLTDLVPRFGKEKTRLAWDSQLEAVRLIESIAHEERIHCDLERLDAFLYTPHDSEGELLADELKLARDIGYEAFHASPDDVPFPAAHAIRFPDQGKFHVRKFLLGLVKKAEARGVRFFEGTEVAKVESGETAAAVTREGHRATGDWLVHATNVPFETRVLLQTKLYSYRTYAIGARVPRGIFGDALYWDTLDPYHYTRVEREGDKDLVILGGEDHKVGTERETGRHHDALIEHLRTAVGDADVEVAHRWSGEILETQDDLPYIGLHPGKGANELVATGDSGTGMTNGAIAALMMSERILGRGTPWDELYDPRRVTSGSGAITEYVKQRAQESVEYAKALLGKGEVADVAEIEPGGGAILRAGLHKVAVSRGMDGTLRAVGAACTHLGCTVKWNQAEGSWDCGCHGSRFGPTGDVLHGPAFDPLPPVDISKVLPRKDAEARSVRRP